MLLFRFTLLMQNLLDRYTCSTFSTYMATMAERTSQENRIKCMISDFVCVLRYKGAPRRGMEK